MRSEQPSSGTLKAKDLKASKNLRSLGTRTPRDLHRIAKICHGYIDGENLSFNNNYITYNKYIVYLINHVIAEALDYWEDDTIGD